MKKNFILFFLAVLSTFYIQAQSIEKVKGKISAKIKKEISNSSWILKETGELISLSYLDTFFINSVLGPINNLSGFYNKPDTLYIKIRFEEKWSTKRVNDLKEKQKRLIDPLIVKYIAHFDSLKWRNIKSNKDIFLCTPVRYLRHWDGLNGDERVAIKNIVRLPDKVIGSVGIFFDVKYNPCRTYIEPRKVNEKVDSFYNGIAEILEVNSIYSCEPVYK